MTLPLDSGVHSRVHTQNMAEGCDCRTESATDARAACHQCGSKSSAVDEVTARALLTDGALRLLTSAPLYFCNEPTCSAVYFATDGQVYTGADLRVAVWQKEQPGRRRICYCFDENEASILREFVDTGRCEAVHRVRNHIAADRCACEVRNPRGTCCLGDLIKAVACIESRWLSEFENCQ